MASRWRIRHKLLLGLGLVVLLMAVLLSGTLRGLWAYYTTTNGIRSKLQELFAAEQLKVAVGELISPENTARMVEAARDRPRRDPQGARQPRRLRRPDSRRPSPTASTRAAASTSANVVAGLHGDLDAVPEGRRAVHRRAPRRA